MGGGFKKIYILLYNSRIVFLIRIIMVYSRAEDPQKEVSYEQQRLLDWFFNIL